MEIEVGSVLDGKVTGITKFGAFVTYAPGKSGLVHISEIANCFVQDVSAYLTEGQEVKVKVIGIAPNGRVNLSIKAAAPAPAGRPAVPAGRADMPAAPRGGQPPQRGQRMAAPVEPSFEDKLKRFMQDSDNKMSGLKQYSDNKRTRRR